MKIFMPQSGFENYTKALEFFGAEVSYSAPESCAGLLLPGGADIHPGLYGQDNMGSLGIDTERDRIELDAFEIFKELKRPIFGICRGVQLINVALGGSLHQDIPGHSRIDDVDRLHPSHTEDEVLRRLFGESFIINSSHHQAVDRPGDGLKAVQWADDGTVEAIRHESLPIFGVQWHPERLRTPTDGWQLIKHWLDEIESI